MEVDGLPIWAKVGDLDISEERFREMESKGVRAVPPLYSRVTMTFFPKIASSTHTATSPSGTTAIAVSK